MRPKIENIAYVRHWWDKTNGNPYFSAQIFDIHMRLIHVCPFQYGNTSHSEDVVTAWVQAMNEVHEHKHDVRRKIYFNHNDTIKRDCVALGKAQIDS